MKDYPNMLQPAAFLGVERSLTGRRWIGPTIEEDRAAEALSQATALPRPAKTSLAATWPVALLRTAGLWRSEAAAATAM